MPAARGPGMPMVQGVEPRGGQVLRAGTHQACPGGGSGGMSTGGAGTNHVAPGYPTAAAGGETRGGGGDAKLAGTGSTAPANGAAPGAAQPARGGPSRLPPDGQDEPRHKRQCLRPPQAAGRRGRAGREEDDDNTDTEEVSGSPDEVLARSRVRRKRARREGGGAAREDPTPIRAPPAPPPPRRWEGRAARRAGSQPRGPEGTPPTGSGKGARLRGRAPPPPPPRPSGREVRWEHVPAHVNVQGNEMANGLAMEGMCSSPLWSQHAAPKSSSGSESTVGLRGGSGSESEGTRALWSSMGMVPMDSDELTGQASGEPAPREMGPYSSSNTESEEMHV